LISSLQETLHLGDATSIAARLEVVAENPSLAAGLFDCNFHNRQKDDVSMGQDELLLFIKDLHSGRFSRSIAELVGLRLSPVIESIADLFD
jgi:hypothetical protein